MNQYFVKIVHVSLLLFFGIVVSLIYSNTLNSPFVFDDYPFILQNDKIQLSEMTIEKFIEATIHAFPPHRNLPKLTFALNYFFSQDNVFGYHLVNIFIHFLIGIILFSFFQNTLRLADSQTYRFPLNLFISFFATLLFLVHPVATQSVTYICQRMCSMAALFYMLSMLLYVKARMFQCPERHLGALPYIQTETFPCEHKPYDCEMKNKRMAAFFFAGSILSGLAAVASKENAGILPIFILLYELYFLQEVRVNWRSKKIIVMSISLLLFFMIVLTYLGNSPVNQILQGYARRDFTLGQRVMTEWRVVVYYLSLLLFAMPGRLNLDHDYPLSYFLMAPMTTLFSVMALAGLAALVLKLGRKDRLASFCILWFLGNLIIESSIIGIEIIYEHRSYLPFMMIYLLFVVLIFRMVPNIKLAAGIISGIVIVFSIWTFQRNMDWKDAIIFYQDSVIKTPHKARPLNNLGKAFFLADNIDKAIPYLQKSLEIDPNYDTALYNMGMICLKRKQYQEATDYFYKVIKTSPRNKYAYYFMGMAWLKIGDLEKAGDYFAKTVYLDPRNLDAHINLGYVFAEMGHYEKARQHFQTVLEIDPDNVLAYINIGDTFIKEGEINKGIQDYARALEINTEFGSAHDALNKIISLKLGKLPDNEGFEWLKKISCQYPKIAVFQYHLGRISMKRHQIQTAIAYYQMALSLRPHYLDAINALAFAYIEQGDISKAIALLQKSITITPDNPKLYYNIACLYARQNKTQESLAWLKQAIDKGYRDWEHINTDSDLQYIRDSEQFRLILNKQ